MTFPLVPEELGRDFELDRALGTGTIPLVWMAEDPRAALAAYVQLYLREGIRAEALVRNLPGFARFLPIAALFHGQAINVAGIARDAAAARTTVSGYLDILEDTLLAFRLPAFEARLRVRERKLLLGAGPGLGGRGRLPAPARARVPGDRGEIAAEAGGGPPLGAAGDRRPAPRRAPHPRLSRREAHADTGRDRDLAGRDPPRGARRG